MRVLMTCIGSYGDLFPFLALGQRLRDRGHSVVVMAAPGFDEPVRTAGLDFFPLGVDETLVEPCIEAAVAAFRKRYQVELRAYGFDFESLLAAVENWDRHAVTRNYQALMEDTGLDEASMLQFLLKLKPFLDLYRSIQPRLYRGIDELYEPGDSMWISLPWFTGGLGKVVQEKLGMPHVYLWPNAFEFRWRQPFLPHILGPVEERLRNVWIRLSAGWAWRDLNLLRQSLGLEPERDYAAAWLTSQQLDVALFPRWFVPWYRDADNCVLAGFPEFRVQTGLAPEVEAFLAEGDAPVVFTTASWKLATPGYMTASIDACRALGRRAVIIGQRAPELVGRTVSAIGVEFADYGSLLPRAAAMVHHGGSGTVAAALRAGLPQLVVPVTYDQRFNASTLTKLKAGLTVSPKGYEKSAKKLVGQLIESSENSHQEP